MEKLARASAVAFQEEPQYRSPAQPTTQHPSELLPRTRLAYRTPYGAAYCGDSVDFLSKLKAKSVNLVVTSPPYALHFKKAYGNVEKDEYVKWFEPFAEQIFRVLADDGSFVLNIGGSYNAGSPTRSLYHFRLLLMLCDKIGFHLAQECFWFNPARLPSPAEWVTVRRIRVKDSVEYVWWFSKTEHPKANNRNVLNEYSDDMKRLIARGYRAKDRPSGYKITHKFQRDLGGSIPANVIQYALPGIEGAEEASNWLVRGNNESNSIYIRRCAEMGQKVHPARFPAALPEFFIRLLSTEEDVVVDPFAGSNTTGSVAEGLRRRWLSFELDRAYVENSELRFEEAAHSAS